MGHGNFLKRNGSYGRLNKKKLAVALLLVAVVAIVLLVLLAVVAVVIIKALLGQADSGIGQSIGNIIKSLWNYGLDFINALWKQVITNPLQFLTGGGN